MFRNIRYQIYLLQLENFHLSRFIQAAMRDSFSPPKETRHPIIWTTKLVGVVSLASLFVLVIITLASWGLSALLSLMVIGVVVAVFLLLAGYFFFFIPLALATIVLWPLDWIVRQVIFWRARRKVSGLEDLTIIGITGSYGKTTMKQTLQTLLSGSLDVVATAESHNTPVAVARTILSRVGDDTDVFIVEMGAYKRGDIAALCNLASPDISILTGINEAHLERFGSIENTIQAKFEIVTQAKKTASIILNVDDDTVMEHFQEFVGERSVKFFSSRNNDQAELKAYDQRFHEDGTGISFYLKHGNEDLGYTKVNHLGSYIVGNVMAGVYVGEELGVSAEEVLRQAHKITSAEHRLQPIQRTSQNVLVIDDSYNGNPDGAHAAIDVLEKFITRRTIYVTPGLVEMGERSEAVHKEIGEHLAAVVDVVVLVETSVTDYIKEGLKKAGFPGELIMFDSPQEMHEGIAKVLKPGDVLLFQNDWPENYR
jgi:UDP-N-acetylmuramoyl-tripeptide--D-alanyl-D-alanine ligase